MISADYVNPTGKQNLRASFFTWLRTQVSRATVNPDADFVWSFDNQAQPTTYPRVAVQEQQFFQPAVGFFDFDVFPCAAAGQQQYGSLNVCLFMFEIQTDQGADSNALQKLYLLRDRIRTALVKAGFQAPDGTIPVPAVAVLDYSQTTPAATGIIARVPLEQETAIQERYIPPALTQQNIHTIQLLVRLEWFEMIH